VRLTVVVPSLLTPPARLQVGPPPAEPGVPELSDSVSVSDIDYVGTAGNGTGEKEDRSLAPLTASSAYAAVVHSQRLPNGGPFAWWQRAAIEHGNAHEAVALRVYARMAHGRLLHLRSWYRFRRNVGGTPDGVTDRGVAVEVKCPYYRGVHPGYIPLRYWWQVQCQLEATGLNEADYMEYDTKTGATNLVRIHRSAKAGAMLQHAGSIARVERCL